jgi:hypothetical protein
MITILNINVEQDTFNVVFKINDKNPGSSFELLETISESLIANHLCRDMYINSEWFEDVYKAILKRKSEEIDHFTFDYTVEGVKLTASSQPYQSNY